MITFENREASNDEEDITFSLSFQAFVKAREDYHNANRKNREVRKEALETARQEFKALFKQDDDQDISTDYLTNNGAMIETLLKAPKSPLFELKVVKQERLNQQKEDVTLAVDLLKRVKENYSQLPDAFFSNVRSLLQQKSMRNMPDDVMKIKKECVKLYDNKVEKSFDAVEDPAISDFKNDIEQGGKSLYVRIFQSFFKGRQKGRERGGDSIKGVTPHPIGSRQYKPPSKKLPVVSSDIERFDSPDGLEKGASKKKRSFWSIIFGWSDHQKKEKQGEDKRVKIVL